MSLVRRVLHAQPVVRRHLEVRLRSASTAALTLQGAARGAAARRERAARLAAQRAEAAAREERRRAKEEERRRREAAAPRGTSGHSGRSDA